MPGLPELMIIMLIFVVILPFWIYTLVDCATKEPPSNDKIAWLLVILLGGVIGAPVYWFARRPKRKAQLGR